MVIKRLSQSIATGILLSTTSLGVCAATSTHYSMADYATVEKIDAHVHINTDSTAFIQQAKKDRFQLVTVNVDYPDFPPIDKQKAIAMTLHQAAGGQVKFVTTFSMEKWASPKWQETIITDLESDRANGAIGVKVWKNIGMSYRDKQQRLVMIDNPGFDALFQHLNDNKIPVIGHQGEPKNCWLPVSEMTVNNDKLYFANHPEYHMYRQPNMPAYEDQMAARDALLTKNTGLPFIGAHLASLEWSVDRLASFLDQFPNAVVDTAARLGQIQYQSQGHREKVRQFFIRYQDRILYATDLTHSPDQDDQHIMAEARKRWQKDWQYFNTSTAIDVPELDDPVQGLALPRQVIDKIYRTNAQRVFFNN